MRLTLKLLPWITLVGLALLWQANPQLVHMLRLKAFDAIQQTAPRAIPEEFPVVVIDIDEKSLAKYGQFPWPRTLLAELVEKSFEQGVSAMAFDIVFAEPDRSSPQFASSC